MIGALPCGFGVEQFGHRRFEAQIDIAAIRQTRRQPHDRFHRKRVRCHPRDLCRDRFVLADRCAPLHALVRPFVRDLQHPPPTRGTSGGNCQAAGIQRDQRELESLPFLPQQVFFRNENVFESNENVADAAQSHELAAMGDLHSGRVRLQNECGDLFFLFALYDLRRRLLFFLFALYDLRRRLRHHDDHFRLQAVCAPQLLAVENPSFAIRRRNRPGLHLRRIGSHAGFRQRKCGDRAFREPRKPLRFLLFRPEKFQRLRHANRLMCGEPRDRRSAPGGDETDRAVVVRRAESETAILFRNLHAPRAERFEAFE